MKSHAPGRQEMELQVNGERRRPVARPADTLLRTLREELGLTAAKPGCENGDCGACTVLVDGWPMKSCLMLSVEAADHQVTTMEGLRQSPMLKAFIAKWAFQCGYCTPGFIAVAHALATIHPKADENAINEWLQSNICRCTGYEEILAAVKSVMRPV